MKPKFTIQKLPKGGFFSESAIRFFRSPVKNIQKNYPELEI